MTHRGARPGGRLALGLLGVGARGQRPVLLLPGERLEGVRQLLLPGNCPLGEQALDGVGGVRVGHAVRGVRAGGGRAGACPGSVGACRGRVGARGGQRAGPSPRVSLTVGGCGLKKDKYLRKTFFIVAEQNRIAQTSQQQEQKIYCIFDSTSFCHIYYSFLISTPHIFSAQSHVNSREKKNHLEKDYAETAAAAEIKIVSFGENVSTILQFTILKVLSRICRKQSFFFHCLEFNTRYKERKTLILF